MSSKISFAQAELSEAEALYEFESNAPEHVRESLGVAGLRLGGGVALSVRNDPTGFWSKALGFGFDEPVTVALIEKVREFYLAQRTSPATLALAPEVIPADWEDICLAMGIVGGATLVKMVCDIDDIVGRLSTSVELTGDLRVAPLQTVDAAAWGGVMMDIFGMPRENLAEMAASSVGLPGWHAFGAWDGDSVVGTGTVKINGETAQMFAGGTISTLRRRGIQSALLLERAKVAKSLGCRWLIAETGAETPGSHNSSLHNMRRLGFEVLYERRNWIWRSPEAATA